MLLTDVIWFERSVDRREDSLAYLNHQMVMLISVDTVSFAFSSALVVGTQRVTCKDGDYLYCCHCGPAVI